MEATSYGSSLGNNAENNALGYNGIENNLGSFGGLE